VTVALLCSANRQIAFFSKLDPGLTTRSGVSSRESVGGGLLHWLKQGRILGAGITISNTLRAKTATATL